MTEAIPHQARQVMRSSNKPDCYLCGAPGQSTYKDLRDRLFAATGNWNLVRCTNDGCGLMWLSPMPIPEDISIAYENYYTHADANTHETKFRRFIKAGTAHYIASKYGYRVKASIAGFFASLLIRLNPAYRANADSSVLYLPAQNGGKLLEIGCGGGQTLREMRKRGWNVTGLDVDPQAVAHARSHGLNILEGSLHSQSFKENSFDVVAMSHVIEHVHDPRAIIEESIRILRPGGRLVLLTPNTDSLGLRLLGPNWVHLDPPRHLYLFNRKGLAKLVSDTGFSGIKAITVPRYAKESYVLSMLIRQHGYWRAGVHTTLFSRIAGTFLTFAEFLAIKLNPNMGMDIVVMGRKPGNRQSQ